MSAYLQKRLEEHCFKLREAELSIQFQAILAQIASLTFVGFEQHVDNKDDITAAFHCMIAIGAQPSRVLSLGVTDAERLKWLDERLQQAGIREECYIKVFHEAPWAKIRIPQSSTWLNQLRQLPELGIPDILILRTDMNLLLGVFEEEYCDEVYIHELA